MNTEIFKQEIRRIARHDASHNQQPTRPIRVLGLDQLRKLGIAHLPVAFDKWIGIQQAEMAYLRSFRRHLIGRS